MKPVDTAEGPRFKIYPGNDPRVTRVVRKIVRGLSHFHKVETAVCDDRVWADILRFRFPDELLNSVTFMHREPDVLEYWYEAYPDGQIRSVWHLKFFAGIVFTAAVHLDRIGATG